MSGNSDRYIARLIKAGIDKYDARLEVREFLEVSADEREIEELVARRANGEPAAYILGYKDFYKDRFVVSPDVLIPRSDTELLVESALRFAGVIDIPLGDISKIIPNAEIKSSGREIRIADLCTGSGCVGISVFKSLEEHGITADMLLCDISPGALNKAVENIQRLTDGDKNISAVIADVSKEGNASIIGEQYTLDIITANPPYIDELAMKELPHSVADYEPELALRGGEDGVEFYRYIAKWGNMLLKQGGALIVEHGYDQAAKVTEIFNNSGYTDIITLKDAGGNDRVTFGRRS